MHQPKYSQSFDNQSNKSHQQHSHQKRHSHAPYRKVPPPPSQRPYTKPLPKLPANIGKYINEIHTKIFLCIIFFVCFSSDEGPESSNDDSRPYSPSLSSSNEDILKPTARIGDRADCDLDHQLPLQKDWLLRSALRGSDANRIDSIDLAYLKDLDLSSTAESQAPSTIAANKEVESSTSFEYHDSHMIRSPFQREIQRILDTSASKIPVALNRSGSSEPKQTKSSHSLHSYSSSGAASRHATQTSGYELELRPTSIKQNLTSINGKHAVGLEAIKEIAKNTANHSDSSLM